MYVWLGFNENKVLSIPIYRLIRYDVIYDVIINLLKTMSTRNTIQTSEPSTGLDVGSNMSTGVLTLGTNITTGDIEVGSNSMTGKVYLKGDVVPAEKNTLFDSLQLNDQLGRVITNMTSELQYVRTGNQVIFSFSLSYTDLNEWTVGGISEITITGFPWTWSTVGAVPCFWPSGNPWANAIKGSIFIATAEDNTNRMLLRRYSTNSDHFFVQTSELTNTPNLLAFSGSGLLEP